MRQAQQQTTSTVSAMGDNSGAARDSHQESDGAHSNDRRRVFLVSVAV
jgi:hypothetical protein